MTDRPDYHKTAIPKAHASTHQDGGSDQLNLAGLAGKSLVVDRGDAMGADFSMFQLTIDNAFHDLDLSAILPQNATWVHMRVMAVALAPMLLANFRNNGNVYPFTVSTVCTVDNGLESHTPMWVACDANQVIEYQVQTGDWMFIDIFILGWITE